MNATGGTTMTTLRQAILQTADHIEENPNLYRFLENRVPECGTQGCLVGWIGYFLGVAVGKICWLGIAIAIIGVHSDTFEDRMDAIEPFWISNAPAAAAALRKYADIYHPEEAHEEVESYPLIHAELARIAAVSRVAA